MNLTEYRASSSEKLRTANLLCLMPKFGRMALDIGARDGHFSLLLAERFEKVIALDLMKPSVSHPKVQCVQGDAAGLEFPDECFDFVFCAEVLEHIPSASVPSVCHEIERVTKGHILIGVPYKQDLRVGRTTCYSCLGKNPPWGHVNSFDERRIKTLFPGSKLKSLSFVGQTVPRTNALSAALMDLAGNPYGTYEQEEPCIHCGNLLKPPAERNLAKKGMTKLALWTQKASAVFVKPRGNWMNVLFSRGVEDE